MGMLTFFELAHILDATLLCLSCVHKHVDVTHLMPCHGVGCGGDVNILSDNSNQNKRFERQANL